MSTRPKCLYGWQEGVLSNQGIVFIAPPNLGREDAMAAYSQYESWLQAVANIWGEVRLTWERMEYLARKRGITADELWIQVLRGEAERLTAEEWANESRDEE
ncbi:MAG: hypothetical protein QNJ74_15030 [Trichodesmium sp. MO_231.B1]|nr:hypothetical protein [Trichodesmium sp. MO_231.B1]